MVLVTIAEVISTVILAIGVTFALIQLNQFRSHRKREVALELFHSFQTPEFVKALLIVFHLPDDLSKSELQKIVGDDISIGILMTTWESLGILVYRGELSLELVDDFFSGPILISWKKLKRHVSDERKEQERDTISEWFQWLAERMMERELDEPPIPAHIAYRDWTPNK